MQIVQLLKHINALHGTSFQMGEQYPDGEQGAFAVCDKWGQQGVLKWHAGASTLQRLEEVEMITGLLRTTGYPAPRYLLIGSTAEGTYSIQETLPGSPIRRLTPVLLTRLLELNTLQRERAIACLKNWHQEAIETVLVGGDGYCLHLSLQGYSRRTANLLRELQGLVSTHCDEPYRKNDIVHGDFQHANILFHGDQISGIIDWQAPGAGDCIFDLTTLLFYAYDDPAMRDRLWQYILGQASLNLISIYCAHLILRQVDWSLRNHDRAVGERYIARGEALLQEIALRASSAPLAGDE